MEATAATVTCTNLSSNVNQCNWSQKLKPPSELCRTIFFRNSFRSGYRSHSQSLVQRAATYTDNRDKKETKSKKRAVAGNDDKPDENTDAKQELQQAQQQPQPKITLDDVNPVGLGQRSCELFDKVWRKSLGLRQISRTTRVDDTEALDALLIWEGPMCEFAIPGARNTTVLVAGATSCTGRIVVRKLMLRGYSVKALVRKADNDVAHVLPRSVEIVIGDVSDPYTLKAAAEGCNKIIYCATAHSTITVDLFGLDHLGFYNLTKAFQDHNNKLGQLRAGKSSKSKLLLAKFKSAESLNGWEVRQGTYFQDVFAAKYDGGMDAKFEYMEIGDAVFSGYVFTRGRYVELSTKLSLPLGCTLDSYEGLILSVGGNGRSYVLILEAGPSADTTQSKLYFSRFSTKAGFCRVRIPFSSFRPVKPDDPPLDPFLVHALTTRFEPRRQRPVEGPAGVKQDLRNFKLVLEYIKTLPTGQETDFILVSCTGSSIEPTRRKQILKAKRAGEDSLRRSGLGYTIILPGPLKEEPGGQRALIFDQGNRITQAISCADVADICVKASHDSTARNKSFDVCYEYVAEQGRELYKLRLFRWLVKFPASAQHHPNWNSAVIRFATPRVLTRVSRSSCPIATTATAILAAVAVIASPAPSIAIQGIPEQAESTLSNIPQTLSGECALPSDCKKARIQRPKSRKAESCTIKCVGTCIRGGEGSPGEGPLNIRRPLVVFKQGFRSRQYCLVECSDICNLIGDGDDGP